MLILLLVAVALFVVLLGVLRLAGWVVRATFPEEELNDGARTTAEVIQESPATPLVKKQTAVEVLASRMPNPLTARTCPEKFRRFPR